MNLIKQALGEQIDVKNVLINIQKNMQERDQRLKKKKENGFNMKDNYDIYRKIDWIKVIGHLVMLGLCLWLWFKIFIAIVKFF